MKRMFLALCAVVALSCATTVNADIVDLSFDISNVQSWDDIGSPNNTNLALNMGGGFTNYHVVGVGFDLNLQTVGASWISEMEIRISELGTNHLFLTPGFGFDDPGAGNFNSGGVIDLISLGFDWNQSGSILDLEFFESFDDVVDAVDGNYTSGSFITFRVERTGIPEPGTFALLGLGTLATFGAVRRRVK